MNKLFIVPTLLKTNDKIYFKDKIDEVKSVQHIKGQISVLIQLKNQTGSIAMGNGLVQLVRD